VKPIGWPILVGCWGGGFVLFIVIVIAASSGNNPKSRPAPENRSTIAPAPVSPYAQGIPDIDDGLARLIDSMLSAAQDNDPKSIEVAAAAIDKARNPKPGIEKAAAKESRVKNSLGLKASKAGNDSEAAKLFFEALKLNSYDQEIADNLGFSLYPIADYSAARKAYYASLKLNPRRSSAWMGLAKVLAITGANGKALNAFELGFRYTKSPISARQALLVVYRDDANVMVRTAAGNALATHYSSAIVDFIKPILGNLAVVKIPLYLPTVVSIPQHDGKPFGLFAQHNSEFSIEAGSDFYKIPVASEQDCRGMYCMLGLIAAQKSTRQDLGGDPVELFGGIKGRIIRGELRAPDQLDFWVNDIRYTFSMGIGAEADIEAANSALKFGELAADALGLLPKLTASLPTPSLPAPPAQTPTPARQVIASPRPDWTCNITFDIALETFGEGVTVELRFGYPGNSSVISTTQSWGGSVSFDSLCPGSYFLAIGSSESVSVTPVRDFVTHTAYRSTIRMHRGSGNVSSKRRSEL
jgi:tetratricopeptide (TPR) repeat protein